MSDEKPDELQAAWEAAQSMRVAATRIKFLERDNERLANLLKTTRDMNVVEVTADRDSWMEQARMAQDQAAEMAKEVERLKAERDLAASNERAARALWAQAKNAGLRRAVEIAREYAESKGPRELYVAYGTFAPRLACRAVAEAVEREIAG